MNIAQRAVNIVSGERDQAHGDSGKNLQQIAALWEAYLGRAISPEDVCSMMILLKVARLRTGNAPEDNLVDIAGYALLRERLDIAKVTTNT
jgi:hypothetical protein